MKTGLPRIFLIPLFLIFLSFPALKAQNNTTCSVFFASKVFIPSDQEEAKLKTFVSLPDSIYIASIELHGFTDDVGNKAFNDSLASKRAESIKKLLLNWNISGELITKTISKGEVEIGKTDKNAEQKRAANRRVDVIMKTAVKVKKIIIPEKIVVPIIEKKTDTVVINKPYTTPELIPDSVKVGDNYRLEDIYFEGDRSTLLPSSNITLDRLLKLLTDKPKISILILGHVCCLPAGEDAPDKNTGKKNLSVGRAKAIYDYLLKKGIDSKRISFKGMKANKKTGKGAAWDRRVEIEILKK